jgi:ribosomal protein S27AE
MIHSKPCFKCKTIKPLSEFYKHHGMADGHLNKCKLCSRIDSTNARNANIDHYRKYDSQRAKNSERYKAAKEINSEWRKADKRRTKCHNAVARAIKNGTLIRQPCVRCGNQKSLAHHEDYDFPLIVMWLCQPCHKQRHKEMLSI